MAARTYLMTAVAVVWVLSITPLVAYLTKGWKTRRDGLLKYFKPHAIALYFRQFYPAEGAPPPHPDGAGDYTDEEKAALTHAAGSATEWLSEAGLIKRPRVAETLEVQAGWERAIETALGDYLEAVCACSVAPRQGTIPIFCLGQAY